jgi:sulfide:quinone oxidoreductase
VCVVGGGTAGLEGLLSARQELGPEVELRLIAPEREFRYRPMSPDSLFRPAPERSLRIDDVVSHAGATWVADRAAVVDDAEGNVITRDGDTVEFDFLLLAAGARSERALQQGYVWARGGDPSFLDRIIADMLAGRVRSVAVAVPRGARWSLPAYELALVLAWTVAGHHARVTLITSEEQPLDALGSEATEAVTRELDAAGIELITGVEVIDALRSDPKPSERAEVILMPEERADASDALIGRPTDPARVRRRGRSGAKFDRLISLPTVVGPSIAGVTTDAAGFVEVDAALKVCGSERVWAAGACIAAALEHSALAARQADAAITAIAVACTTAGPVGAATPFSAPELTGMLLTGQRDHWLAENPVGTREPSTRCLWWPPGRAVGRMLAQQIAAWDPSVQDALPSQPNGLVIRAPVALGCSDTAPVAARGPISAEDRNARVRDIENRQLMAIRRRERAAEAQLRALSAQLQTLAAHQQEVIRELQHQGYLRNRA